MTAARRTGPTDLTDLGECRLRGAENKKPSTLPMSPGVTYYCRHICCIFTETTTSKAVEGVLITRAINSLSIHPLLLQRESRLSGPRPCFNDRGSPSFNGLLLLILPMIQVLLFQFSQTALLFCHC